MTKNDKINRPKSSTVQTNFYSTLLTRSSHGIAFNTHANCVYSHVN